MVVVIVDNETSKDSNVYTRKNLYTYVLDYTDVLSLSEEFV